MKATYSINLYDIDGDVWDECVLIHIGNTILKFDSVKQVEELIESMQVCVEHIKDQE